MALFRTGLATRGAAFGLIISMANIATAQAPSPAAQEEKAVSVTIANFGKVDDRLYRGGQPRGGQYRELAALGIKTVVNLRDDFEPGEQKLVEAAGMTYRSIPMNASRNPTDAEIETFLSLVSDESTGPVYVHCREGRHRAGVMTAIYRLMEHDWTADQAYEEMKKYRFRNTLHFLFGHENLRKFVYSYHAELQKASAARGGGGG